MPQQLQLQLQAAGKALAPSAISLSRAVAYSVAELFLVRASFVCVVFKFSLPC